MLRQFSLTKGLFPKARSRVITVSSEKLGTAFYYIPCSTYPETKSNFVLHLLHCFCFVHIGCIYTCYEHGAIDSWGILCQSLLLPGATFEPVPRTAAF